MLAKTDGINYKGLVAAISSVSGKELVPVMEKEQTEIKNDPMMGFLDRLNNLGEKNKQRNTAACAAKKRSNFYESKSTRNDKGRRKYERNA